MTVITVPQVVQAFGGQIQVTNANLFQLASQYLGDATQWNLIADMNGVFFAGGPKDYLLVGAPLSLSIPPYNPDAGNGGIEGQ